MAFNITAIMNVALASGAATKISRDLNKALQNKRVTVDLSLANPDSIKRIKADIEGAITSVESFGRQAGLAAKRFGAFSLAAGSMITLVGAIKSSTAEAISFDREMVRLGQVSNDSVASIQAVGNEVTRLSVALGVSSKDLIGAAVTLKQANLSIDDTKIALEALAKAALAPNFENFANTTQGAIAVLNQFKIGAAGLEAALGSVNAVAGEYAVEASDLIEAIRKTGGAFKSAGGDLNELLALFTSVRQTTRESAETISTGLRTIFTRIQRGQTIESLKDLGIQLRYTSQEAAALGNIKLEDQFVGPYEAVRRLSEALSAIPTTSGKYSAIVEELGGYRQISKVIPLLQEFSVSQGALNIALGGSSSLAANAAQAQNAYIIKIQKIKEEFNALIRSVTQSSGFQKIFDTFISGASAAIQLADALKFLLPLITAIAAVKLATSFGQFVKGFATGVTASPNPKIFNQNRVAEGGYIKMKNGGVVPGSGSGDKVKALLEPGELVIPKKYAGGGTVSVNEMSSLAIQRKLNDPLIKEEDYKTGKTINKNDNFKYEIVTIKVDGGKETLKGDYKQQGDSFEKEAEKQLGAIRIAKSDDRGSNSPVDLEKNGFPYEVKNVSSPVSDASIVDKLARYRFQKFGDNIFKNSSKGEETIDLGQIGLVYNTAKMTGNDAFKDTETITAGQENYRRKTYATQTSEGISNVTLSTQEAKNRLATKKASGGFMIPGTGNTDSFPMDLDEGSFVVRKSSVAKLGAENLHSMSRKGYAKGGKVPALLMPGEFVFSPSSAKSIGSANLERMNKHAKFAAGGRVGLAEGGNPNPIGEEAYTVASQTKIKIPNFQKIQEFANSFPDLTAAQESLRKIILEEVRAFSANLSETQKLAEASRIAADVMRRYEDIDNAIKAQQDVIDNRSSTATQPEIDADAAELRFLKRQRGKLTKEVGLSSTVLPTGDAEFRTKIGSEPKPEIGKGKEYDYAINEKRNISDEIRNRARDRAVKISPSGDGENIASVTKTRLAAEEESKLRKELVLAIGEQLRITTGITDKEVLSEMAVEKFTIAMQQNAKIAKDSEGRLLGLVSLEQDIVDSGKKVDQSMRGVSQELKVGSTAIGKLKLVFRNAEDIVNRSFAEFGEEVRKGGGGISGFFSGVKNSKLGRIVAGSGAAIAGIGGQYLASTAGTAEDVSRGAVSEGRYVASSGIGEAINQGSTAAIALSMIPVAGPFLAVIGGATAGLVGLVTAVNKARMELLKVQVDKMAKGASEKISELRTFSGVERQQKGMAAFTDVRSTVFDITKIAAAEGLTGAKLQEEVRAKSLEKFGSNLGSISEELSNAISGMVKPDDKRKSVDIYNEFKGTAYGQLAIESLGIASGKSAEEAQKQALALASSAIAAKKLEDAQKNSIMAHEKITLRIGALTNSINLASESFKNISESMGNFSDKLEGKSEFKIQQSPNRLKMGTDTGLFNKEADKTFAAFGELGNPVKAQAKALNAFVLELPSAFEIGRTKAKGGLEGNVSNETEAILKSKFGIKKGEDFSPEQKELFKLVTDQITAKEGEKKLGEISGEKLTKETFGSKISEFESLLQSNAQALNQVTQSYISGLRRISDEQRKYIQELDRVSEKSLAVNKADAAIKARKVRGNAEDFLTKEQRIAPFVEKQTNITAEAVKRGDVKIGEIQDPQAIFDSIKKAAKALGESDTELQASNADLASSNDAAREKARGVAEKNNNLRDTVASLGEALRNLRDETVTLAEAESRLTKAEKDRENKLSVVESLLTMDKAGKRNLQRGKDAAEQVAGGANLEDMSTKQKKAFFDYTKLYGNIKVPELGGKTGEQIRQIGLERASGGQGVPIGEENKKIDQALQDMKTISENQKKAAEKYAELIKVENSSQITQLKAVNDKFIAELGNLLAKENNRGITAQIDSDQTTKTKLEEIKKTEGFQQFQNLNLDPKKEKEFASVFGGDSGKNIKEKLAEIKKYEDQIEKAKLNIINQGPNRGSSVDNIKFFQPKLDQAKKDLNKTGYGYEEIKKITNDPSLEKMIKISESLNESKITIATLPTEIERLRKSIEDLTKKIVPEVKVPVVPPVDNKANGGFIGRSMGGSIYNNPTKDIAQRDQYPTLLSKGEFVMNEGAARNNRPELEAMNKGHKVNYFAEGTQDTTSWYEKFQLEQKKMFEQDMQNPNTRSGQLETIRKKEELEKGNLWKWTKDRFKETYIDPLTPNPPVAGGNNKFIFKDDKGWVKAETLEEEIQGANNLLTNRRKKNPKIDYKDEQALGNATKLPSLKPFQDVKKKNADITSPFSRMNEEESNELESHLNLIIPNLGKLGDSKTDKDRRKEDIDNYKAQLQSLYTVGQIKSFISSNKLLEKLKYVGLSKTPDKNTGNIISLTDKPTNWYSTPSIDERTYLGMLEGLSSDKKGPIESKKPYSEGRPSIENDYLGKSYSFFNKFEIPRIENGSNDLTDNQKIRPEKNSPVSYILKEREEFLKAYNDYRFLQNNDSSGELRKLQDPVDDMGYYYREITSINQTRREEFEKNVAGKTMPDGYPETIYPPITTRLSGPDAKKSNANAMGTYPKVFGQLEKRIAEIKSGRREVHADERIQYLKDQIQNLEKKKSKTVSRQSLLEQDPKSIDPAEENKKEFLVYLKKREISQLSRLSPADSFWTEDREGKKISNSDLLDEDSYIKDAYRVLINNRSKNFYDRIRLGSSPEEEVQELNKRTVLIKKAIQEIEKGKVEKEKKTLEENDKRESVKGKIELTGQDAVTAKREANLQARIKDGRRSNAALPYPVDSSGEFTKEGNELPVFRPTRARKEEFEKQDKEFMSEEAKKERAKNRKDDAAKLKEYLFEEAIRHTNPKDLEGKELTYENVKAFGGEKNEAQKIIAFKKTQVESGDTDPIAQRLHTQIAKTIASSNNESDTDPRIYGKHNHRFNIKDYKAEDIKEQASKSLKEYANYNMPVLNPAIMALREYYDSVDQRRFGFDQTEDFARTIKNKDIELAAKMDREAVMLIARKVRGEVKVEDSSSEVSPIGDAPKQNIVSLLNAYNKYHGSLSKNSMNFNMDSIEYDEKGINFQKLSQYIPVDREETSKKYNEIYSGTMTTAKDLVNIYNKNDNLSYARPYYEKTKITQAELEKTIIDETNNNIKNTAIKDFLERQKKEKPVEAAKTIAVEQEKTVATVDQTKSKNSPFVVGRAVPNLDNMQLQNNPVVTSDLPKLRRPILDLNTLQPQNKPEQTKPVVAADQPKSKISDDEIINRFFTEGPKEGSAVLDFNQNGIRIQGSPEQEKEYATVQTYLNSPTYKAMKILQDKIDNIKLKQSLDIVKDSTAYPENAELSDTIYLRWLNEQVSTLKSQDIISEPYKEYAKLVTGKIGEKFIDFKSSGGPVAYRSGGGGVSAMLTPNEMVFTGEKAKNPILPYINNGGEVKNFGFGGSVSGGSSFTVPAHGPEENDPAFARKGTDSVAYNSAKGNGIPEGSFVVKAQAVAKNKSLLTHLASGGSVGYYEDGGITNPAANYFSSIGKNPQEKNNGFDVNSFMQKAVEEQKAKEEKELKNRIAEKQKELVDDKQRVMALNKNRANQTLTDEDAEFLRKDDESNSGAMHKFDYMMAGAGIGKALFNGAISLGHHTIKQASKHVGKESAIEASSILAMMGFEKSTHAAVNSLTGNKNENKKDGESLSSLISPKFDYDKKQKKGPSYASAYANGGVVQYYQNAGMVKRPKTISEIRQEEKEARERETKKIIDRSYDEGGQGIIGGIRENEKKIFLGDRNWIKNNNNLPLNQERVASLSLTELQEEIINKLTDKQLKENLTPLEADKLQRAKQEFANRIKKIRYNEGFTQNVNFLNSQKRGGKKDNTEAAERFEDFLRNNNIKGKAYDGLPNALKGKDIDKSYLTGIAHFAPNILKNLNDEKIKNIVINLIKQRKIKGFSGDSSKFQEANYFGELGDRFNTKDVFLKMSDITPVIDLLNRVDKGRETNLNSTAKGQRIKSKNPLNAKKFMEEYGTKDEDGNPMHTALTARAEYFNPNIKEEGYLNLKPKENENPKLMEHTIEDMMNRPRRFNLGGYVNGASYGDSIDATLRAGEFVLNPEAAKDVGYGNLEKINKQRFFDGGAVGSPRASVFDKMNNVANSQSANSMDVDSLNNAAREFNKAAKSFETSMAKMEKSVNKLEGTMDKLSKVNIPDNITGNITVNNQATVTIDSPNFLKDINTAVGKAVSDITGRLNDVTEGRIDIRDTRNA